MKKAHPERVHPRMALEALRRASGDRQTAWTKYIIIHYNASGGLAPGCDARDLYAWLSVNAATEQ